MEAASEPVDRTPNGTGLSEYAGSTAVLDPPGRLGPGARRRVRVASRTRLSSEGRQELLWITVMYVAARGVLLLAAYLEGRFGHHNFLGELANWDGDWYRRLANHGYPAHVDHGQTTLGFFPAYPLAMWLLTQVLLGVTVHNEIWSSTVAGLLISAVGGWVTTLFVYRLACGWWDRAAAQRATVLFVVFPGAVVFSMVYSEGLLLPIAAICIYCLERKRWVAAGLAAGVGTAVQPVGLVLGLVCASAALVELWRGGWRSADFRRSLLAPILSATGVVAFLSFLWAWTGNPMATYIAQHHGWGEKTDPVALIHAATRLAPSFDPSHFNHPVIDLNLLFGEFGAVVMAIELVLLWFYRRELSVPAIVWTVAIIFFAYTSEYTPPNPRMLITAFPGLMLLGRHFSGRAYTVILYVCGILFILLSLKTFVGHSFRP